MRLVQLARDAQRPCPRSTDIRAFLYHELENAYDLMERGIPPRPGAWSATARILLHC